MKTLAFAAVLTLVATSAHAAGCLVFDATAPTTLADGSVVFPISATFPTVVPIKSCVAGAGSLIDSSAFLAVDVSATCHPIKVGRNAEAARDAAIERLSQPVKERVKASLPPAQYTTAGLYTDGKGNCGPLAVTVKAVSTKQALWSEY
jgi:hypothetical protein